MIHHACYRWNEESKISPKRGEKKKSLPWVRGIALHFHCTCMRGDDIHVNDVWWRISCIDSGFVITMSYGRTDRQIDRLIEGQYDSQRKTTDGTGASQTEDIYLVAMLGLRIKMDCFIPINSIPRCSAIAEGWQLEGKQKRNKRPDYESSTFWHKVEQTKIGITATDTTKQLWE